MPLALALSLLASLAEGTAYQMGWGARAEGRGTAQRGESAAPPRTELALAPNVSVEGAFTHLRLSVEYAPRLWSDDVADRTSPLVTHVVTGTAETPDDRPLRARARVGGVRGRTDPFEDARRAQAMSAGVPQIASPQPITFEELNASAAILLAIGLRTGIEAEATGRASHAADPRDDALLPPQRGLSLRGRAVHLATERDALTTEARASRTLTETVLGETTAEVASATVTWRRRLSPRFDAWVGAGGALLREQGPAQEPFVELRPVGELGTALVGEGRITGEVALRATTLVDRFTGTLLPMFTAIATLRAQAAEAVTVVGTLSAGSTRSGEVALGGGELRAIWSISEQLSLEGGALGRWQRDARPTRPSLVDTAVFVTLVYQSRVRFGASAT